jgi:hypothetical protein
LGKSVALPNIQEISFDDHNVGFRKLNPPLYLGGRDGELSLSEVE